MEYIHKPKYIAVIASTCVVFTITMVFNGLAGAGAEGNFLFSFFGSAVISRRDQDSDYTLFYVGNRMK